jgi:hypothetical protein
VLKGDKCAFDLLIQSLLKGFVIVTLENVAGTTKKSFLLKGSI